MMRMTTPPIPKRLITSGKRQPSPPPPPPKPRPLRPVTSSKLPLSRSSPNRMIRLLLPEPNAPGAATVANLLRPRDRRGEGDSRMILEGKVALVTGSTSGIGLAIATALAAEGAKLMINGFGDPEAIGQECRELGAIHDGADLSDPAAIARMMTRCADELGGPDILVNNAGIQHVSPVDSFPPEKWDAIIAINLSAAFHTIRLAVPAMRQKGWGRIINTASAHSLVASPNKSAYVAAKHGIAGLTKTVALEAAPFGVTVNCISPGYVWTSQIGRASCRER